MRTKESNRIRMLEQRQAARLMEYEAAGVEVARHRTERTRIEYAEFLKEYNWDYFLTTTFRQARREPYYALKHVSNELRKHNVRRAFLAAEPHQSGDLHIHGIAAGAGAGYKPEIALPWVIWSGLFNRFGRSKVELCNTQEDVANYCSKYVLKQQNRACDYYELFGDPVNWSLGRI